MINKLLTIVVIFFIGNSYLGAQQLPTVETIKFRSLNGGTVQVTTEWYKPAIKSESIFVLFHQAGSSRGEYNEICQRLNRQNFSCYAVDLRSGKEMNGVENETYKEAKLLMKSTSYLDAYKDMETALNQIIKLNTDSLPIYIVGSSYSASLSIRLVASVNIPMLKGLILFSPGEYFQNLNGQDQYVKSFLNTISVPIWVSSSRSESSKIKQLFEGYNKLTHFIPNAEGHHGAKALWSNHLSSEEYWLSMQSFYNSLP